MKSWPLRTKLTLWSALVTGLALLTFGGAAAVNLYFEEVEALDHRLNDLAKGFLAAPAQESRDGLAMLVHRKEEHLAGGAYSAGKRRDVVTDSPAIAELLAGDLPGKRRSTMRVGGQFFRLDWTAVDGRSVLLVADLWPAFDSVLDLLGAYLLALPVVLFVVAAGSWWMARRALQPIADITNAAASITAHRLGERLPQPAADDEIGRHIRVLNEMFDRLERSFAQATRFTADASHELRTPLTILRGQIEEALRGGQFTPEQERLLLDLLEETSGLQKIADNLLLLARFDLGKDPIRRAAFDFSTLTGEACEDAELLAAPKEIAIKAQVASGILVDGDSVMLRRVILNLIDNAVKYNRPGGEVHLALRRTGSEAVFTIGNHGPGIPEDRRGALFERFFRLSSDRNSTTGGSGLGLSLCREIVTAHGGRIELASSTSDWTEFRVHLPAIEGKTASRPPGGALAG
jgi:signal transduction histidine kinase